MANNDFLFHNELSDFTKERFTDREPKNISHKRNSEHTFIDFVNTNKKICKNIGINISQKQKKSRINRR